MSSCSAGETQNEAGLHKKVRVMQPIAEVDGLTGVDGLDFVESGIARYEALQMEKRVQMRIVEAQPDG